MKNTEQISLGGFAFIIEDDAAASITVPVSIISPS